MASVSGVWYSAFGTGLPTFFVGVGEGAWSCDARDYIMLCRVTCLRIQPEGSERSVRESPGELDDRVSLPERLCTGTVAVPLPL